MGSKEKNEKMILEVLSIGEDVNLVNFKLQQLLISLRSDVGVLGNVKELSGKLVGKVRDLDKRISTYVPTKTEIAKMGTPSYITDGKVEPQRVVPGPKDYDPTIFETNKVVETPPVPAKKEWKGGGNVTAKEVQEKRQKVNPLAKKQKNREDAKKRAIKNKNNPNQPRKPLGNKNSG